MYLYLFTDRPERPICFTRELHREVRVSHLLLRCRTPAASCFTCFSPLTPHFSFGWQGLDAGSEDAARLGTTFHSARAKNARTTITLRRPPQYLHKGLNLTSAQPLMDSHLSLLLPSTRDLHIPQNSTRGLNQRG